jgi:hypothetical protein
VYDLFSVKKRQDQNYLNTVQPFKKRRETNATGGATTFVYHWCVWKVGRDDIIESFVAATMSLNVCLSNPRKGPVTCKRLGPLHILL